MKFFTHWSKATATEVDRDGKDLSASCWGWSETSSDDAHRSALAAARRVLQRLLRGEPLNAYSYGQRPLREEIIESFADVQGKPALAVTRNAYGVLVLNTARVMFIDVDLPPVSLGTDLRHFFFSAVWRQGRSAGGSASFGSEAQDRRVS